MAREIEKVPTKEFVGKRVVLEQVRSGIGHPEYQRKTLRALGLGRIGRKIEHKGSSALVGMVDTVSHLVTITRI